MVGMALIRFIKRFGLLVLVAGVCIWVIQRCARSSATDGDGSSTIGAVVRPTGLPNNQPMPALIVLPTTGYTAQAFVDYYLKRFARERNLPDLPADSALARWLTYYELPPIALVYVPGKGSAAQHGGSGFRDLLAHTDTWLEDDLPELLQTNNLDPNQTIMLGYSLGGDLAYALVQNAPDAYHAAIVLGSRCSYRTSDGYVDIAFNGTKVYLGMGKQDAADRLKGMQQAYAQLRLAKADVRYQEIEGLGHDFVPPDHLRRAIAWSLRK